MSGVRKVLVLGGARSGKSTFAERLAAECGEPVLYVATATVVDDEMAERIALHQRRRPTTWRTLEAPTGLTRSVLAALADNANRSSSAPPGDPPTLLVEDLTLLLSNLFGEDESIAEAQAAEEVTGIVACEANVILVSNEVGMGLVPPYPLGRRFRDALGRLNQLAAAQANEAYLVVAGVPLRLK